MWEWLKKLWRSMFGPSLNTLNTEVAELVGHIHGQPKSLTDDVLLGKISALFMDLDKYAKKNPASVESINVYKNQIALRLFQKNRLGVLDHEDFQKILPLQGLANQFMDLTVLEKDKKIDEKKVAFCLYHGATLRAGLLDDAADLSLSQVMKVWTQTDNTHANYKPFLQHVYREEKDRAWATLQAAFSITGDTSLSQTTVDMLNKMKNIVLNYFFASKSGDHLKQQLGRVLETPTAPDANKSILYHAHPFKHFYGLLNTWAVKTEEKTDTVTIKKLRLAYQHDNKRVDIVKKLLTATQFDMNANEPVEDVVVEIVHINAYIPAPPPAPVVSNNNNNNAVGRVMGYMRKKYHEVVDRPPAEPSERLQPLIPASDATGKHNSASNRFMGLFRKSQ